MQQHMTGSLHAAEEADALAQFACARLGHIDIWVNNAGVSQRAKAGLEQADAAELKSIVDTNLLGSMYGARAALKVDCCSLPSGHTRCWPVHMLCHDRCSMPN
jgi:NAD(P)-dependent dehydrogenase (short-subunit alcohol dehydrogenase family)